MRTSTTSIAQRRAPCPTLVKLRATTPEAIREAEGTRESTTITPAVSTARLAATRMAPAMRKIHLAADTLGHLLALKVTPANAQDRGQVADLTAVVQEATGETVEMAFVDQGYTGAVPATAAAANGIDLVVVRLPQAKRGFVLLPRRWVVERSFAWASRFRRLARGDERLPETVAGLHFVTFACLMVKQLVRVIT
jgi:transposase